MIGIIDYEAGNLRSVQNAFNSTGYETCILTEPEELLHNRITGAVLPGVGSFPAAYRRLAQTGFISAIKKYINEQKYFLGICLGYQLLFCGSEEDGGSPGLGVFPGRVVKFSGREKIPHMGWNRASVKKNSAILSGIDDNEYFYFVHSYYPPDDSKLTLTTTFYEKEFASGICSGNVFGFQFHPEKSHIPGRKIIKNFGALCAGNTGH
ncbi:MAG: imidazole glycerol phosphate synthase, glutamine amidotransferase subunit [Spirochaetes bacterium GWF1_41_5]|nr:MAG: imidazole glycerol phosphate synthase, glutamine amidotransferase subunit [Spirochaetes bacterium GWF1_41_5]HBE03373.1 imidazole glycerol phosphate synthase subunit HisH [Spirochaetia bacterium]